MAFDTLDNDPVIVSQCGLTFTGADSMTVQSSTATSLGNPGMAQAIEGKKSGKWYVEWTCVAVSGNTDGVGIVDGRGNHGGLYMGGSYFGEEAGWGYYTNSNVAHQNSTVVSSSTYGAGDVIGVAIDLDNARLWFRKNGGSWIGPTGVGTDPATNTDGFNISTMLAHNLRVYPAVNLSGPSAKFTANFGATSFAYTVPSGFTSGWTNTTAGEYFGTFASTGNSHGNEITIFGQDILATPYTSPITGTLDKVVVAWSQSNSHSITLAIYADDGVGGIPGTLLGVSTDTVDSLTYGEYEFAFSGFSLTSGTTYWFAYVNAEIGSAHQMGPGLTNGIYYHASGTPGVPDNPFPSSPSSSAHRFPMLLYYTSGGGGGGGGKNNLVISSMGF